MVLPQVGRNVSPWPPAAKPALLRNEAQTRWEMLEEDRASEEEKAVTAFEQRHDLAQEGVTGDALPFVRPFARGIRCGSTRHAARC